VEIEQKLKELRILKKKFEEPLYKYQKLRELDWQTKLSFWVTDVLDAIDEGRKRHKRKKKSREGWWERNSERLWTITEGICKLIIKIL